MSRPHLYVAPTLAIARAYVSSNNVQEPAEVLGLSRLGNANDGSYASVTYIEAGQSLNDAQRARLHEVATGAFNVVPD